MEDKEKKDDALNSSDKENIKKKPEENKSSGIKKDSSEKRDKGLKEDKTHQNVDKSTKNKSSEMFNKIRKNPWAVSTIVLVIIVIVLLFFSLRGDCITGSSVSSEVAGENLVGFLNSQVSEGEVTLDSIEEDSGFYKATLSYQGQQIPLHVTKDGDYIVQGLTPLESSESEDSSQNQDSQQETEDIPSSEMPLVELYVMSFCPYGNEAENTLYPVYELLKNSIHLEVHYIVSVSGDSVSSLHGQPEVDQNMREMCVKEDYGMDKWFEFVTYVNDNCGSNGNCWEDAAQEAGLDTEEIETCVENRGLELMKQEANASQEAGATGSPTMLINGVKTRTVYNYGNPDAYKSTICDAFTEEARPSDCDTELSSSDSSTPTGGSC